MHPWGGCAGDGMRLGVDVVLLTMRWMDKVSGCRGGARMGLGAVPRGRGAVTVDLVGVGPGARARWPRRASGVLVVVARGIVVAGPVVERAIAECRGEHKRV